MLSRVLIALWLTVTWPGGDMERHTWSFSRMAIGGAMAVHGGHVYLPRAHALSFVHRRRLVLLLASVQYHHPALPLFLGRRLRARWAYDLSLHVQEKRMLFHRTSSYTCPSTCRYRRRRGERIGACWTLEGAGRRRRRFGVQLGVQPHVLRSMQLPQYGCEQYEDVRDHLLVRRWTHGVVIDDDKGGEGKRRSERAAHVLKRYAVARGGHSADDAHHARHTVEAESNPLGTRDVSNATEPIKRKDVLGPSDDAYTELYGKPDKVDRYGNGVSR